MRDRKDGYVDWKLGPFPNIQPNWPRTYYANTLFNSIIFSCNFVKYDTIGNSKHMCVLTVDASALHQWRNVISGGLRFKIFEGPPSRSTKGTSWAPYMREFSKGSKACSPGKFLNLDSLKCHFLDFGERFYRILMVRKRHCDILEALANVFALSPKLGGPHLAHWGWGPPGSPGLSP
jgi:hypothetical protein